MIKYNDLYEFINIKNLYLNLLTNLSFILKENIIIKGIINIFINILYNVNLY